MTSPRRGVRYRADVGWEMRCDACVASKQGAYWPLTLEFWDVAHGLWKCRACWVTYNRDLRRRSVVNSKRAIAIRKYQREWAARKRIQLREAEGRERYERKKAA